MAKRTQTLSLFPWNGGVVTNVDQGLLQAGQLTVGDNVVFDYPSSGKRRREGIDNNWDGTVWTVTSRSSAGTSRTLTGTFTNTGILVGDLISIANASNAAYNVTLAPVTAVSGSAITYTAGSSLTEASTPEIKATRANKVIGGIDYWFGTQDSRAQWLITVLDNGAIYRTANGHRNRIVDKGIPWTINASGLTEANLEVFNNRVFICVSGVNNCMKYWNGDITANVTDVPALLAIPATLSSVSRASSGTTRTLIFNVAINVPNGTPIVIEGPANYAGSYTLLSGSGTTTITYTASTSLTEGTTADTTIVIGTHAPYALFLREHQGRLLCNDKQNLDRYQYSEVSDHRIWGGVGTSGGHDIGIGDGDPSGLTGISPAFKGDIYIGKKTKLYRLIGQDQDTVQIVKQSNGIGFASHQAIVGIDQDSMVFVSDRGVYNMTSTNAYGAVSVSYISQDIQNTFVKVWSPGRRRYIKAAYLPEINSVAFAVSDNGAALNNAIWFLNIQQNEWYRWPNLQCEALISAQDTDRRRVYLGTYSGRLAQTQTSRNVDITETGATSSIFSKATTGVMFLDGRPDTIKEFKRLSLIFQANGSYQITAKAKIDNYPEQALSFVANSQGAALGAFTLGTNVLGNSSVLAPYSLPIDGAGRSIKISVEQADLNTSLSVQGFIVEFEGGMDMPETKPSET